MKHVMHDRVARVEERIARRWVRGSGDKAEFEEGSEGWWLTLDSLVSFHLGAEKPELRAGDRVRVTLEKVKEK